MPKSLTVVAITMLASTFSTPLFAASSDWFKTDGAQIRLVSQPSLDGKTLQAGLQIELEKGWKTYWRSPGASGLPPQISFSGSKNIASTQMAFPIPSTFGDEDNLTAGYLKSVTFPIYIEPLFPDRPITLNANGILGICGKVCVPVQFQLSLKEDGKGISTADITSVILKSRSKLVTTPTADFKIQSAEISRTPSPILQVKTKVPTNTQSSTLFIEGPDDWYLTPIKAKSIQGGIALFSMTLDNLPQEATTEKTELKFTLVADGKGITQDITPKNSN